MQTGGLALFLPHQEYSQVLDSTSTFLASAWEFPEGQDCVSFNSTSLIPSTVAGTQEASPNIVNDR